MSRPPGRSMGSDGVSRASARAPRLDQKLLRAHRGWQPITPGHDFVARSARQTGPRLVSRRSFRTADALIVVSTDGYFDVFPPIDRSPNDKPNYRGVLAELGPTVRGADDRLFVRPESVALDAAVSTWSRDHGAAAVRGDLGGGRDGKVVV